MFLKHFPCYKLWINIIMGDREMRERDSWCICNSVTDKFHFVKIVRNDFKSIQNDFGYINCMKHRYSKFPCGNNIVDVGCSFSWQTLQFLIENYWKNRNFFEFAKKMFGTKSPNQSIKFFTRNIIFSSSKLNSCVSLGCLQLSIVIVHW